MSADEQNLILIGAVVVVVLLGAVGILAGVLSGGRRRRCFDEMVRHHRLALQPMGHPWMGPVALGVVHGTRVEVGPVDGGIRFRTETARPMPRGLYVHSQTFRHNTAGPRQPGSSPYDGSADELGVTALTSHVPEIVLNDPELDQAFVIQGDDEQAVRSLLTRPDVRHQMLSAAVSGAHVRLRNASVELDVEHQKLESLDAYEHRLTQLLELARIVERA